jgi:hypothetical protein
MTIKQQGGVFGRNPEFSDVGVKDLSASGSVSATTLQSTSNTTVGGTLLANAGRIFNATLPTLKFQNNSTGQGGSDGFWIYASGTTAKIVNFENAPVEIEANGQARLICSAIGDVSIPNGNLNMTIGNVVVSSGKGIDFSATAGTGTSELFDDYEEGTWTPAFDATVPGTGTTTNVTSASYVKVGRLVTVAAQMDMTVKDTTASGFLIITGLPYASAADNNASNAFGSLTGLGANAVCPAVFIGSSLSHINFIGTGTISVNPQQFGAYSSYANNTLQMRFSISYIAA